MNLRDYQEQAIESALDSYDRGVRSGIICFATGMGKSLAATNLAKDFRQRHGGKTLFLIDRIELAEQTRRAFLATDPNLRIGIEMNVEEADKYDDITICSIQTIGRKGSKRIAKFASPEYKLILADEVHMSVAPIWLRALHFLGVHPENFADNKMLVGLTATPYRTDGKSLGYLYDDIFAQYDIRYGIKNGWLTDIEWIRVKTATDISKVKVTGGEFAQAELTRTVDNPLRNSQIVKAYLDESPGESAIVFCAGVQHAYTMAEMFKQAGVEAECIEGGTDKEVRRDWITDFRSGKLKVLTNHAVLTTGFDAPETSTIILARPIRSTLTYTQIVGRGLRPSASAFVDFFEDPEARREGISHSDKPACKLIDFEDNVGNHNVCRPPMLFGLNPNAKTNKKKTTLFKDVVEVLDEVKKKSATDVSKLIDLDDIKIMVERKRVKFTSYNVDDIIKDMSKFMWLPIGEESYELLLSEDNVAISIEKDMLDRYNLIETQLKTGVSVRKQTFSSLQGAVKVADEYIVREKFNTTFLNNNAPWLSRGVSFKQASLMKQLFKGGCRFGPGRYPDTGQLHVHINNNFVSSSGEANNILKERFTK
jgi:superfamily II DNA or RNA helicase